MLGPQQSAAQLERPLVLHSLVTAEAEQTDREQHQRHRHERAHEDPCTHAVVISRAGSTGARRIVNAQVLSR